MYTTKQNAINHYLEVMNDSTTGAYNKVEDVVWVNSAKMIAVLQEQSLTIGHDEIKLPPMVEANWDTNDTKEFDRLLHKVLFEGRTVH